MKTFYVSDLFLLHVYLISVQIVKKNSKKYSERLPYAPFIFHLRRRRCSRKSGNINPKIIYKSFLKNKGERDKIN